MAISLLSLPLRYFLQVARTGSVNQAAQRLHVAASAVSRQLGKLEDSLGVALFERQAPGHDADRGRHPPVGPRQRARRAGAGAGRPRGASGC